MDNTTSPKNFVDLATAVPEVRIDARYAGDNNFVGRPIEGYDGNKLFLTREAAAALRVAQASLSEQGLTLLVLDAYRPQRAVDDFVAWAADPADEKMKADFYPTLTKQGIFDAGMLFERSSHTRGSTVDLTLVDADGAELDMGTQFDFFGPEANIHWGGVTPVQAKNRITLATLMIDAGFEPYAPEWWHFTLKEEPYPDTYFNFTEI